MRRLAVCDGPVALTTALEQGFTLAWGGRGKETGTNETTPVVSSLCLIVFCVRRAACHSVHWDNVLTASEQGVLGFYHCPFTIVSEIFKTIFLYCTIIMRHKNQSQLISIIK